MPTIYNKYIQQGREPMQIWRRKQVEYRNKGTDHAENHVLPAGINGQTAPLGGCFYPWNPERGGQSMNQQKQVPESAETYRHFIHQFIDEISDAAALWRIYTIVRRQWEKTWRI